MMTVNYFTRNNFVRRYSARHGSQNSRVPAVSFATKAVSVSANSADFQTRSFTQNNQRFKIIRLQMKFSDNSLGVVQYQTEH